MLIFTSFKITAQNIIAKGVSICLDASGESQAIIKDDFGSGASNWGPQPSTTNFTTTYGFSAGGFLYPNQYGVVKNASLANSAWVTDGDHTTGKNGNGYMLIFDANSDTGSVFYQKKYTDLCAGSSCTFSIYAANIISPTFPVVTVRPKVKIELINPANNQILQSIVSDELEKTLTEELVWKEISLSFIIPNGVSDVVLKVSNAQADTNVYGNDVAFDDVSFSICVPSLTISTDNEKVCANESATLTAKNEKTTGYTYQWQQLDGTNWIDIPAANSIEYKTPALAQTTTYRIRYAQTGIDITNNKYLKCSGNKEIVVEVSPNPSTPIINTTAATCLTQATSTINNYIPGNSYTFNPTGPTVDPTGLINGMILDKPYTVISKNTTCESQVSLPFKNNDKLFDHSCFPVLTTEVKSLTPLVCNVLGEIVTYEIKITNSGIGDAHLAILDFIFPKGITFDSATSTYTSGTTGPTGALSYGNDSNNPRIGTFNILSNGIVTILLKGRITSTALSGINNIYALTDYQDPTTNQNNKITSFINAYFGSKTYSTGGNVPGFNFNGDLSLADDVTITSPSSATITYPETVYAATAGTALVNKIGQSGGKYTASPAGLSIDENTGTINLGESLKNTYTITYTFIDSVCNTTATATTTVTIESPKISAWLSVQDANNNGVIEPGENITFILRASNISPDHRTIKNVTGSIDLPAHTTLVSGADFVSPSKFSFSLSDDFPYLWDLTYQRDPAIVITVKADCDLTDVAQIATIGRLYIDGVEIKTSLVPIPVSALGTWITTPGNNKYLYPPNFENCTNPQGCPTAIPVSATKVATLNISNPASVCSPNTIDLSTSIKADNTPGIITYWNDAAASVPLTNFTAVSTSGNYYIKSRSAQGCELIKPVVVTIYASPTVNKPSNQTKT
ncbi:MAG: hypothetical protein ABI892_12670, partial [Flavobacterium sp.]